MFVCGEKERNILYLQSINNVRLNLSRKLQSLVISKCSVIAYIQRLYQ